MYESDLDNEIRQITLSIPILPQTKPAFWAWQLLLYKRVVWAIIKRHNIKYNIIHSVGVAFSGVVGSYISQKTNIKHVAQCIGSDVNITLPKIQSHRGVRGFERYVNRFVCNSFELKSNLERIFPLIKSDVVYRGVNLDEFQYYPPKKSKHPFTFFYLGGLSERKATGFGRDYKGGITLLNAWQAINDLQQTGESDIKLIFGGPEVSPEVILSISPNILKISNLHFVGELGRQEVVKYMAEANAVIIPSHMEGFPNVAFEAMASGCALIVSNVGGIPEIVKNNINGIHVEPGDESMLAQTIVQMAADQSTYQRIGALNRQIIEECYSLDKFVAKYSEIYSDAG